MLGNLHPHLDAGELAAELLHGIDDGALAELGHVFRGVAHLVHHRAVVVTHSLQLTVLLDSLKNAKINQPNTVRLTILQEEQLI